MKRIIKKCFWVNQKEAADLRAKAEAACLTEAEFLRQMIAGYTPVQMPDDRFFKAMDVIREMADKLDAAMQADSSVNMIALMTEAKKWRVLQNALEKEFLRPKRSGSDGSH